MQGVAALRDVRARCPLPLVAIGGITRRPLAAVLAAGADAVAMIGAIAARRRSGGATRDLLGAADPRIGNRSARSVLQLVDLGREADFVCGAVLEAGVLGEERQRHGAGRTVALLADDDLGLALVGVLRVVDARR